MNVKTSLLGLIGSLVIAGAAQAETPLFSSSHTSGVLGASADWTAITFAELSTVGVARFSFSLLPEQTIAAARQTFSVNGAVVFKGSDTAGAYANLAAPIALQSFAFDSNIGARHAVSTAVGNTPTINHSGAYELYRSVLTPSTYAIVYEDDFRSNSRFGGDFNDMVVRVDVAAVPEPETYALMLAGIVAFFFVARRRKRD